MDIFIEVDLSRKVGQARENLPLPRRIKAANHIYSFDINCVTARRRDCRNKSRSICGKKLNWTEYTH